jgi:hypothetical protein
MALAIGCWVRDTALQVNKREVEYKKAMINSMYKSDSIMNTTIKGMQGYSESVKEKQQDFKEETNTIPWIYKG